MAARAAQPASPEDERAPADHVAPPAARPAWPGVPPSHSGLTRRLKALLKTGPFHRLRSGQGRFQCLRPHDDPTALCLAALDTLINAMGISGGVSHEELTAALEPLLHGGDLRAGAAPDPARYREVAQLVIGVLLNDPGRRQAYEEAYLDFDTDTQRLMRYRLASEQETPEGRIVLRAEPDGVNLVLRALDIELEDAQAATEAALRAQLERGRFDLALHSAHEARVRSIQYHDKIHALLRKTQRDVGNVDWRREVPRLLKEALAHLDARQRSEREISAEVQACLARLVEEEGGGAVDALLQMQALIDDCCQRHLQLHPPLLGAYEIFRDEQARQRFAPLPLSTVCAPERAILTPTLLLPSDAARVVSDAFVAAATPAQPPQILDLSRLWDLLLRPRRHSQRGALGPALPAEALQPIREEPPLFDEDVRQAVDDRLLAVAAERRPRRMSELLPAFDEDERAARLLTLRCLHHFAPDVQVLPLRVERTADALAYGPFAGDDLLLHPDGPEHPTESTS